MFGSALDKKKKSLDYIETAPKVLMSRSKVEEVYGLTTADIRELQSTLSVYYEIPFFNGRSIWHKIQDLPIVKKLQGNDWMLTCIMRQQDSVASISVAGGCLLYTSRCRRRQCAIRPRLWAFRWPCPGALRVPGDPGRIG